MNPVHLRMLSQQLAAPQFHDPAEVVGHFGAMQAQEYRLMRWAVAMRTRRPSATAFRESYDAGRIVRLHLMRGTWQLVTGEDYHWMLAMFGGKAEKVISGWMSANNIVLPDNERRQILEILLDTTAKLRSATKEDYAQALAGHGIVMDDHRLSYHIRFAELGGHLCSGDLLPMKATYALTKEKLKWIPKKELTRDEMLRRIARKYFQSHSPATFGDFVWWTGLGVGDCRRAIALLGSELRSITWRGTPNASGLLSPVESSNINPSGNNSPYNPFGGGSEYELFIHESCRTRGFRSGSTLLLPSYDEYLIGYKSREIVLPQAFRAKAHNNSGNFSPIVLHDGIVCGNWAPFTARNATEAVTLFPTAPTNTSSPHVAGGFSADGFSADGFSDDGFSDDGFSADGQFTDGFSADGPSSAEISAAWEVYQNFLSSHQ